MKKLLIFLTVFCLFAMGGLYGQNFTLSIHNQHPIHPEGAFYFDIYMLRTGATALYLGNADLVVTFNSSNFTNPTYVIVSEGMTGWYTFAAEITSGNRAVINISQPPFGDQPQFDARVQNISNSGNGTLIAQVKITGISDPNGYAGIQWRTSTPNAIVVNALSNVSPWGSTDITGNGTFTDPPDVTLPVELSIFSAIAKNNRIVLHWITESEQNNTGFNIYRSLCPNSGFKKINGKFIEGAINSTTTKEYFFEDYRIESGTSYYYMLEDVDIDGLTMWHGPVEVMLESSALILPDDYYLQQNFPNPFNPTTDIKYGLPDAVDVSLIVYNLRGEQVRILVNEFKQAGHYTVQWDGHSSGEKMLPTGIYIYRLRAGDFVQVKKMMFAR